MGGWARKRDLAIGPFLPLSSPLEAPPCKAGISLRAPRAGARSTARTPSSAGSPSSSSRSSSAAPSAPSSSADEDTGNGSLAGRRPARSTTAGFPDEADEQVLVQGTRLGQASATRRSPPRSTTSSPRLKATPHVQRRQVAARQGQRGPALQGRPLRARHVQARRATTTSAEGPRRRHAGRHRGRPEGQPAAARSSSSATPARTRRSSKSFDDDFKKAEFLSLPITLLILIVAFGALVAAGVPLLLGAHRRDRHARPARPDQPARPDRRVDRTRSSC